LTIRNDEESGPKSIEIELAPPLAPQLSVKLVMAKVEPLALRIRSLDLLANAKEMRPARGVKI